MLRLMKFAEKANTGCCCVIKIFVSPLYSMFYAAIFPPAELNTIS